jgi:hypothetical protein
MYLLDPERGGRRRALLRELLRDRATHAAKAGRESARRLLGAGTGRRAAENGPSATTPAIPAAPPTGTTSVPPFDERPEPGEGRQPFGDIL